jgi:hypothetical protein
LGSDLQPFVNSIADDKYDYISENTPPRTILLLALQHLIAGYGYGHETKYSVQRTLKSDLPTDPRQVGWTRI